MRMSIYILFQKPGFSINQAGPTCSSARTRGRASLPACTLALALCFLACLSLKAQTTNSSPGSTILQDLDNFREMGSVLYVAAHPDDENNELIAYLSRGRHYRTAYLSLTRGDGGQNVLGPVFGEDLGVVRTEELLAAGRIDGAQQFFSRAMDFGFSKDYRQTLNIWDEQEVMSDIVRVIREFRPDVVITRFSLTPGGTHGHHTASAVLSLQVFKLAGDPLAFPEQLREGLTTWQPKRILWNVGGFQNHEANGAPLIRISDGGIDPLSGEAYTAIAARSRSMHKTQGLGNFAGFGGGNGARHDSFELLAGEPATNDIMDGVNTTWSRVPAGGAAIEKPADDVITRFDPNDPAASVPALLEIKKRLDAIGSDTAADDPVVREKYLLLKRIIQKCLGLTVQTTMPQAEVVPGETLHLHMAASVQSDIVPVRWMEARCPTISRTIAIDADFSTNVSVNRESVEKLPADMPINQPYWLREPHSTGMFRVDDFNLIGQPENPPAFPIEQIFVVNGQTLIIPDQPVQVTADRSHDEPRDLTVISPVKLNFANGVELFAPGASHPVTITVTSARPNVRGVLRLVAPDGWDTSPASKSFRLGAAGDQAQFTFYVTAPIEPTTAAIGAIANVNGRPYSNERVIINYPHIPLLLLQPRAQFKAASLNLAIRGHNVGYLPGAGDDVAQCIAEMGYQVTPLTDADLTAEELSKFDAIVIGVRAFNVRDGLASHTSVLFDYVKAGGNVIEQYNRPGFGLKTDQLTPYSLHLSDDRVTDPAAPITFLAPDNPVLNTPNKITSADFAGWVQERGTYFPDQWDDHFTPILACSDVGETPLKGGLLVAPYGQGHFVYTGFGFFRQLPAGVPGAYRLFANLISLGK
jgi:LmbE family N-acetylglucosaminyl deacetylase